VYFLGEYTEGELIRQEEEVLDAVFVTFEQAMAMIPFANAKSVLQEADAYIDSLVGEQ
jgi:NADH pyrophosphatase NudC (nudix superfamily)